MRLQKGKMKSDIFLTLSSHQWPPPPLPTAPSVSGSGFSLGDSSVNSRPQSVADSRGFSPMFDDEMDLGMPDSGPSVQSEPSSTTVTGNIACSKPSVGSSKGLTGKGTPLKTSVFFPKFKSKSPPI